MLNEINMKAGELEVTSSTGNLNSFSQFLRVLPRTAMLTAFVLIIFYFSLITTSQPVKPQEMEIIDRAINVLEEKGFDREVFLLRRMTTFRRSDNWLNKLTISEDAYAATNRPFPIITIYSDFYDKAQDDTERAMILLHEAQHIQNKDEQAAYAYVWRNRKKLGWTILSHGLTPTFIATEVQTREFAPKVFTCPEKMWSDCTENERTVVNVALAKNSSGTIE
jgi:hypothetical protein